MPFSNPDTEQICRLLHNVQSIAVVGLSPNEARPSNRVARALQSKGYRIIPVRPRHGRANALRYDRQKRSDGYCHPVHCSLDERQH